MRLSKVDLQGCPGLWGTGTLNILKWCKENQNPSPIWEEQPGAVMVTFFPSNFFMETAGTEQALTSTKPVTGHVTGHVTGQDKILEFCKQPRSAKEIMEVLGLRHRESFYKIYLKPLLQQEFLLMTIPNKPKSKNQQYVTNFTKSQ